MTATTTQRRANMNSQNCSIFMCRYLHTNDNISPFSGSLPSDVVRMIVVDNKVHKTFFTYTHSYHCSISRPDTIGFQFGNYINDSANPTPTNQSSPPNNSFSTCHPHNRPTTMTAMTLGGRSGASSTKSEPHSEENYCKSTAEQ